MQGWRGNKVPGIFICIQEIFKQVEISFHIYQGKKVSSIHSGLIADD